jgi:mycothiol synthase
LTASIDIRPFHPDQASDAELASYHRLLTASRAVDKPDAPVLTFDAAVGGLTNTEAAFGPARCWAAYHEDRIAGIAKVGFPSAESSHIGMVAITVSPEFRRQGIGTELLRVIVPALQADGRRRMESWVVTKDGAGDHWASTLGFQTVYTASLQRMIFAETDQSLWDVATPSGYRTERWKGAAPEELVDSYAQAKQAIQDAPTGQLDPPRPNWTAQRVRQAEAELRDRNIEQRVVVAVHETTGTVAGLTEVALYPHQPEHAYTRATAVPPEHRGHGLGRYVKAAMARWLVAEQPGPQWIGTSTAATNTHMIRVNRQIGFTIVRTVITVAHDTDRLAADLAT